MRSLLAIGYLLSAISAQGQPPLPPFAAPKSDVGGPRNTQHATLPSASALTTKGAGALALLSKSTSAAIVIPPTIKTNCLQLSWPYTNWLRLDQPFPGLVVFYDGATNGLHRLVTNYFELQRAPTPAGPWTAIGITNRSPFRHTTTNSLGFYRLRSFCQ
jgi:hypothetical protein